MQFHSEPCTGCCYRPSQEWSCYDYHEKGSTLSHKVSSLFGRNLGSQFLALHRLLLSSITGRDLLYFQIKGHRSACTHWIMDLSRYLIRTMGERSSWISWGPEHTRRNLEPGCLGSWAMRCLLRSPVAKRRVYAPLSCCALVRRFARRWELRSWDKHFGCSL